LESASRTLYQNGGSNTSAVFNPHASDTTLTIPLTSSSDAPYDPPYQQWDSEGRAVGYAPDPRIYAPQPKRFENPFPVGNKTSTVGTIPLRHESTDTVAWELQTNAEQGQSYRLDAVTPVPEPLQNPFDDGMSSEPATASYAPPAGPPPSSATAGAYALHSFTTSPEKTSPPPSYISRQ